MQIKWHGRAQQDLRQLRAYIADDNPSAATRVAVCIVQSVENLRENVGLGRPGRIIDTRELVIAGTPYIVPYRVVGDMIVILRVLHGARQWPDQLDT